MIHSFKASKAETLSLRQRSPMISANIQRVALQKLRMLNRLTTL